MYVYIFECFVHMPLVWLIYSEMVIPDFIAYILILTDHLSSLALMWPAKSSVIIWRASGL